MRQISTALLSLVLATQATFAAPPTAQNGEHAPSAGATESLPPLPPEREGLRVKRESAANGSSPANATLAQPKPVQLSRAMSARPSGPGSVFLEKGVNMCRHGLYGDGLDFFTRAANADPKNMEIYNRRARAEWHLGQMKEALEDANWALKLSPDSAEVHCTRAAIHNSQSQYQEAIADASMARDLNPNLRDAYLLEAVAYRNLGQHSEAEGILGKLNDIAQPETAFDEWQPNIDYTPYLSYLQTTVQQKWHAPQGILSPAVALFKVHRDGHVSDLRLNSTTGDSNGDKAALEAVRSSAPFRQPPAGSPPDIDVYIVLEPSNRPPDQHASAAPSQAPAPARSQFNWGGTLNTGLGIFQRCLQFVR